MDLTEIANLVAYSRRAESQEGRDLSEAVAEAMLEFAMLAYPDTILTSLSIEKCTLEGLVRQEVIDENTRLDISAWKYNSVTPVGALVLELKTASQLDSDQAKRQIDYLLKKKGEHHLYFVCREGSIRATQEAVAGAVGELCGEECGDMWKVSRDKDSVVHIGVRTWQSLCPADGSKGKHLYDFVAKFAEASAHPFLPLSQNVNLNDRKLGLQLCCDLRLLRDVLGKLGREKLPVKLAKKSGLLLGAGHNTTDGLFGVELDPFAQLAGSPYWLAHNAGRKSVYHVLTPDQVKNENGDGWPKKFKDNMFTGPVDPPITDYPWEQMQTLWTILRDVHFVATKEIDAKCKSTANGNVFTLSYKKDRKVFTLVLDVDRWSREDIFPIHVADCTEQAKCSVCTSPTASATAYREHLVDEARQAL